MQAEYPDGIFGEVEEFNEKKLLKHLEEGANKVDVFKTETSAHKIAMKKYSGMTKNQRKRFRKKQKK